MQAKLPFFESPFKTKNLFSRHYLELNFRWTPEWSKFEKECHEAFQKIKQIYSEKRNVLKRGKLNEAQLEEEFIKPVLNILGHIYDVQPPILSAFGTFGRPDYAFFPDIETKNRIKDKPQSEYFKNVIGVGEAKPWGEDLDRGKKPKVQEKRIIPSLQISTYLRVSGVTWGVLTNGRRWRLYSKETSFDLDSYFEVDLVTLIQLGSGEDFKYFFLFFRKEAFVRDETDRCFLDDVYDRSIDLARALGESVEENVYEALKILTQGFLEYPDNDLTTDNLKEIHENCLIILYRLLFILYAEARDLLPIDNKVYTAFSLDSLKKEIVSKLSTAPHTLLVGSDIYWSRLNTLFSWINEGSEKRKVPKDQLYIPAYNGGLFDPKKHPFLEKEKVGDLYLAKAINLLARPSNNKSEVKGFIDYSTLTIHHLGSIYERLLEYKLKVADEELVLVQERGAEIYVPIKIAKKKKRSIEESEIVKKGDLYLATDRGERRATGSFFTPDWVVKYMIRECLSPVVQRKKENAKGSNLLDSILSIKVLDPAMGSGHFLVEATTFLANVILDIIQETDEELEEEPDFTWARRLVVERCIYGVDVNPLAVELAKVSLWLHTVAKDRSLAFLDHHFKCGNSLLGVDFEELSKKIPGDETKSGLWAYILPDTMKSVLSERLKIVDMPSNTPEQIEQKNKMLESTERQLQIFKGLANVYLSTKFGLNIGTEQYVSILNRIISRQENFEKLTDGYQNAQKIAEEKKFFYWEFEFPEVYFDKNGLKIEPGFDCVIGNPPYINAIRLNEILSEYEKPFWKGKFDSAEGAYDIFVLFYEHALNQTKTGGIMSFITPNKYLSAPYAQAFRSLILKKHTLVQLCDISSIRVFEDPSVYPIISFFRSKTQNAQGRMRNKDTRSRERSRVKVYSPPSKDKLGDEEYLHIHDHPKDGQVPENLWSYMLLQDDTLFWKAIRNCDFLEDHGTVQASSTASEAENFTAAISEEEPSSTKKKFIKTGAIDPFFSKWEFEQIRHQGKDYTRPVLDIKHEIITELRREQYKKPKLIFAKVASYLEAFLDLEGQYASVDTNFFYDASEDLRFYTALLNSEPVQFLYTALFGALRMRGGDFQFQAPQLKLIPIPQKPQGQPYIRVNQTSKLFRFLNKQQYDKFIKKTIRFLDKIQDEASRYTTAKMLLCELTERLLDIFIKISKINTSFNPFRAIPQSTLCKKLPSVFSDELKFCRELNEDQILQTHHDIDRLHLRKYEKKWRLSVLLKLREKENGEWKNTWIKDGRKIRREWKDVYEIEMSDDKGLYYMLVFKNLNKYEGVFIPGGKTRSVQQKINEMHIPSYFFNEQVRQIIELMEMREKLIERTNCLKQCVDNISYYMYGMNKFETDLAREILEKMEAVYSRDITYLTQKSL